MSDSPLIIETGTGAVDSCVIWLHGLGADGHDFEPIVAALRLPPVNIRFVFPHAPRIPVTINQGMMMRAWYDIRALDIAAAADETGIRRAVDQVTQMVVTQIDAGINSQRIVLVGFSQGGAVVLQAGLRQSQPLAGIMALSTYLPLAQKLVAEKAPENQNIALFLAHGAMDPVIPILLAQQARTQLEASGYRPEWHEYATLAHGVSEQEIADMGDWFVRLLGSGEKVS